MAKEDPKVHYVDDSEWEVAVPESGTAVVFEGVGASFIGTFDGTELIDPLPNAPAAEREKAQFNKHFFKDGAGNVWYILGGFKLDDGLGSVPKGSKVRITFTGEVPMGVGKNPMKDYRIEVAKSAA